MTQEVLKLALEQRITDYLSAGGLFNPELADHAAVRDLLIDCRKALAQEQEPVEWGVDWGKDGNSVSIIKRLADGNIEVLAWEYAPNPPQRTWVGLTQDQINNLSEMSETVAAVIAADLILKQVNGYTEEKNT